MFQSNDPAANAAIAVFLALVAIAAIAVGAIFIIPIVIVIAIAKGVHWYANRPAPTHEIYAAATSEAAQSAFPNEEKFADTFGERLVQHFGDELPSRDILNTMIAIAVELYRTEDLANPIPPLTPQYQNTIEEGRYRDQLLRRMERTSDPARTIRSFTSTLSDCFSAIHRELPPFAKTTIEELANPKKHETTVRLLDVLPDVPALVEKVIATFLIEDLIKTHLFDALRNQIDHNLADVSGASFPAPAHKFVLPTKHKGTPEQIVRGYLAGTLLEHLFFASVPFSIPIETRFEHTHIIGGSGHGKTQLLQHLILYDLQAEAPPALIVIDSQGEMLRKIELLELFSTKRADKLVLIDPEDVEFPAALNMFDVTSDRSKNYSAAVKEQIAAGVIELYNYIFGAIAAEMTSRQSTAFTFVTRLMLSIDGATIHTLLELMEDQAQSVANSKFAEHIRKLDPTSQAYFENQFFTKRYSDLRQQVARRLYSIISVPAFDRMFSAKQNKLDIFEAMQSGKVVLINTSKAFLKSDASSLFGRFTIALTLRAAFERVATKDRPPAFLIIDEASDYFDEGLEPLLSQARKFNLGVVFAHQHLEQLTLALRSSVAANTSIKLAGGVSDRDARALAPDMRTTAEFITSTKKHAHSTEFACHVRNYTANAVRIEIPFGSLEGAPQMSPGEHQKLIARNRERYATGREPSRPAATDPDSARPVPPVAPIASPAETEDEWRS